MSNYHCYEQASASAYVILKTVLAYMSNYQCYEQASASAYVMLKTVLAYTYATTRLSVTTFRVLLKSPDQKMGYWG